MFKIKADPTFAARLTITGQGREQTLNVTFRAMTRTEYADMLKAIADGGRDTAEAIVSIIEKWDADAPVSVESVKLLQDHQPGADWAIITGYGDALTVARKGN